MLFLSTPSARRATNALMNQDTAGLISIHALREEGDYTRCFDVREEDDFYPRPPRGGRHPQNVGGTASRIISIHALREEGDRVPSKMLCSYTYFYPRPPRGGRRGARGSP